MATRNITSLAVSLVARTNSFTRSMRLVRRQVRGVAGTVARASRMFVGYGAAILGVVAGGGIALLVKQSSSLIDNLAKTSDKLGVTTEALSALRHGAELSGVKVAQFDLALQRMTRRVADAAMGSGEAVKALSELGLSAASLVRMSPDKQLELIADAMSNVASQSDRVRLAFKLFDSGGVGLVNMLSNGAAGLQAFRDDAERLGIAVSRVDAKKVENANDAFARLRQAVRGAANVIAVRLAPFVEVLSDRLVELLNSAGSVGATMSSVFDSVAGGVAKAVDFVRVGFAELKVLTTNVLAYVASAVATVAKSLNTVAEFVGSSALAQFTKASVLADTVLSKGNQIAKLQLQAVVDDPFQRRFDTIEKDALQAAQDDVGRPRRGGRMEGHTADVVTGADGKKVQHVVDEASRRLLDEILLELRRGAGGRGVLAP